jgi:predicted Zn-dependent protease
MFRITMNGTCISLGILMKYHLIFLYAVLLLTACATSPLGRQQFMMMPEGQMNAMGVQAFAQIKQKTAIDRSNRVNEYVTCMVRPIVREVGGQWEVVVFRDETPNAFALPGGKIGVNTGILKVARNQSQLATVLGHEISHVLSKHSNERLSQQLAVQQGLNALNAVSNPSSQAGKMMMGLLGLGAQYGILLPYSRVQESEADIYGLELMARAGFDPRESVNLWMNMERAGGGQPVEFLSTHPSHSTRIHDLQKQIPKALALYQAAQTAGKQPRCDRSLK